MADMDMYATVLDQALSRASTSLRAYIFICNSDRRRSSSTRRARVLEIFKKAGAELIDPSCGACINAGPGASAFR
jgi:3-isopropylmalate/(R)-2-methylmalate dehydratase large subunit